MPDCKLLHKNKCFVTSQWLYAMKVVGYYRQTYMQRFVLTNILGASFLYIATVPNCSIIGTICDRCWYRSKFVF